MTLFLGNRKFNFNASECSACTKNEKLQSYRLWMGAHCSKVSLFRYNIGNGQSLKWIKNNGRNQGKHVKVCIAADRVKHFLFNFFWNSKFGNL